MVRQEFGIEEYWKVIVFYDVDYGLFDIIARCLLANGISRQNLETLYAMMRSGEAKGVTYSDSMLHVSIVLINKHRSPTDYLDTLVHEAEHVKQAMLEAYQVEDAGEPPAYTIGHIISKMWRVACRFVCQ